MLGLYMNETQLCVERHIEIFNDELRRFVEEEVRLAGFEMAEAERYIRREMDPTNRDYVVAVGSAIREATSRYLKTNDFNVVNRYILQLMENYQNKRKAR